MSEIEAAGAVGYATGAITRPSLLAPEGLAVPEEQRELVPLLGRGAGRPDTRRSGRGGPVGQGRLRRDVPGRDGWTQALLVLLALYGKPGFPDLHDGTSCGSANNEPRTVRWGLQDRARCGGCS